MGKLYRSVEKTQKKRISTATLIPLAAAALILLAIGIASIPKLEGELGYPRRFEHEVLTASREYGLDSDLIFAIIHTESHFEKDAVSKAGAQGLMQIMPVTAEWIAWRRGFTYDSVKIFDPAYNIDLGCYLLSYLIDYYNSDLKLALAAYNAGHGNVDKWLKDPEHYDGETLDIPFGETRSYVEKVLDSYEKYKNQRG